MWGQSKTIAIAVLLLVAILGTVTFWYSEQLAQERQVRVEALLSTPAYEHCLYDESTCPQVESFQIPNTLGASIILLSIVLAGYLWRSDRLQQNILQELRQADQTQKDQERLDLVLSVLKNDEQKVLLAIKEQPGITQNTLRLRTDFSKGKLSMIIKELETRNLVKKVQEGRTNSLHLKRVI